MPSDKRPKGEPKRSGQKPKEPKSPTRPRAKTAGKVAGGIRPRTSRTVKRRRTDGASDDRARPEAAAAPPEAPRRTNAPVTVVGIGASAGGLEAFSQLLHALPSSPGLALVLVQHLSPQHESSLAQILRAQTDIPVVQATDGVLVERDRVYVSAPNAEMRLEDSRLRLSTRPTDASQYTPVDVFLRSLAEVRQDRAIAIIMSGTASDGTLGVREVKAMGGIAIAQRPETAKYDGMPRAAIASGLVDMVLSPPEIARALVQISQHPYLRDDDEAAGAEAEAERAGEAVARAKLVDRVLVLLRNGTGVDFRQYKRPTLERRLHRRMVLHRLTRLEQFVRLLEDNPSEVQALFQDVLILVTRFFRDPEVWETFAARAIPKILENHRDDDPIRVWVAGCSTGEEAYSVAMMFLEQLGDRASQVPLQIFATDVNEQAIDRARDGTYGASAVGEVSPGRLRRFFTKTDGGFRINKSVRELCVFARQDLTRDPPFSRMDLILCRNVLIYLNASVQQRLMALFHYALKPHGFLLLGTAETIGQSSELFRIEEKHARLYAKRPLAVAKMPPASDYPPTTLRSRAPAVHQRDEPRGVHGEADRLILERYAPPGVVVDGDLQILQFRGHTGAFLEPAPGDATLSLLKMAREGLQYGLRAAVQAARRTKRPSRRDDISVKHNGSWQEVCVEVIPLTTAERGHVLVLFHPGRKPPPRPVTQEPAGKKARGGRAPAARHSEIERLQQELASNRDYLQTMIQELEAANEELQSANEEVLSANEELQSTNEELDTAKEELQSTNEELNTVNDELRGRNEELSRANADLENLLASVQIAIVIVSRDLRIRRFTPMAERVLNLIPADLGRPISHINPNVECPDLEAKIIAVLDSVTPQETEVRDRQGNRYALRIRPYKDLENRIDGAVLALFDAQRPVVA